MEVSRDSSLKTNINFCEDKGTGSHAYKYSFQSINGILNFLLRLACISTCSFLREKLPFIIFRINTLPNICTYINFRFILHIMIYKLLLLVVRFWITKKIATHWSTPMARWLMTTLASPVDTRNILSKVPCWLTVAFTLQSW